MGRGSSGHDIDTQIRICRPYSPFIKLPQCCDHLARLETDTWSIYRTRFRRAAQLAGLDHLAGETHFIPCAAIQFDGRQTGWYGQSQRRTGS